MQIPFSRISIPSRALVLKLGCIWGPPRTFKKTPDAWSYPQGCWFSWSGVPPGHWDFQELPSDSSIQRCLRTDAREPSCAKCEPWMGNISTTRELAGDAESQAPPWTCYIWIFSLILKLTGTTRSAPGKFPGSSKADKKYPGQEGCPFCLWLYVLGPGRGARHTTGAQILAMWIKEFRLKSRVIKLKRI